MPARRVTDQQKEAMSLEAAAFLFAPHVGPSCDVFWASILEEGQPLPQNDEERIVALGQWLRRSRERTVEADDAYDESLRARHDIVSERNEATKKLRATILEVRRNFEGVYGQGKTAKILGLVPDITDEAVRLQRYARAAVKKMQRPGYELPEAPRKVASIRAVDVVAEIAPDLEALEGILENVDTAKRFVQRMLKDKDGAAERLEEANLVVGQYLEVLFRMAGEKFLAKRLRQSSHVSSPEPEPVPEPPPEPGDDEVAAKGVTANPIAPPEVDDVEPPAVLAEDLEASADGPVES